MAGVPIIADQVLVSIEGGIKVQVDLDQGRPASGRLWPSLTKCTSIRFSSAVFEVGIEDQADSGQANIKGFQKRGTADVGQADQHLGQYQPDPHLGMAVAACNATTASLSTCKHAQCLAGRWSGDDMRARSCSSGAGRAVPPSRVTRISTRISTRPVTNLTRTKQNWTRAIRAALGQGQKQGLNPGRGFLETMHTKGKAVARCRQGRCKQGQGSHDQGGIKGNQAGRRPGGAGHCRR